MPKIDLNTLLQDSDMEIEADEAVFGAVLIVATKGMNDRGVYTRISTRSSHALDFITYRGMMELAHDECLARSPMTGEDEDDDDPAMG